MTMTTEALTIHLPIAEIQRLKHIAEISWRSIDEIITQTIRATLPPLLEEIPITFRQDLMALEKLPNEILWQQLHAQYQADLLARYDELLEHKALDNITAAEQQELAQLRHEADLLMFRKAYAALVLKWRGVRIPTLAELEAMP